MKRRLLFIACLSLALQACALTNPADTRTTTQQWYDQQIEMEIGGLVNKPPFREQVRANAIAVDGKVLLIGQAANQATSQQLESKVREFKRVKTVFNQLQIRPPAALSEVSQDSWLTTKVKTQLIGSKKLRDATIQVYTAGQEVYLLGYVTPEQGNVAAEIARNVSGVKKVVKVFEYPPQ